MENWIENYLLNEIDINNKSIKKIANIDTLPVDKVFCIKHIKNQIYKKISFFKNFSQIYYREWDNNKNNRIRKEFLIDSEENIIFENYNHNVSKKTLGGKNYDFLKKDLIFFAEEFQNNISKLSQTIYIADICWHFSKNKVEKNPIELIDCHSFPEKEYLKIKQIEKDTRDSFEKKIKTDKNCVFCGTLCKNDIAKSHLISNHQLKALGSNYVYTGANYFMDLDRPINKVNHLNEKEQHTKCSNRLKIAAFCSNCENKFKETDNVNFSHITDKLANQIVKKTVGIYLREEEYKQQIFNSVKLLGNKIFNKTQHLYAYDQNKINIYQEILIKIRNKTLTSYYAQYKDKVLNPFFEGATIFIIKKNFYLFFITNNINNKEIIGCIITNDNTFIDKKNNHSLYSILYTIIGNNTYSFYSKEFFEIIKNDANDVINDFYTNEYKDLSYLVSNYNYVREISNKCKINNLILPPPIYIKIALYLKKIISNLYIKSIRLIRKRKSSQM